MLIAATVAALAGAWASERSQDKEWRGHYRRSERGTLQPGSTAEGLYDGDAVQWIGDPGEMVWVRARDLWPRADNIMTPGKAQEVCRIIQARSRDGLKTIFESGYAHPVRITLTDVREFFQYPEDYPEELTTGDDEIDQWLMNPGDYEEDYWVDYIDEELEEEDEDAAEQKARDDLQADMQRRAEHAMKVEDGDLGRIVYRIRDANHRIIGAVMSGESGAWVKVSGSFLRDSATPEVAALVLAHRR